MEPSEKLDLVVAAIAPLQPVLGNQCALSRTPQNGLDKLKPTEVADTLYSLKTAHRVINYQEPSRSKERNKRVDPRWMASVSELVKSRTPANGVDTVPQKAKQGGLMLLQEAEFRFEKLPAFDDWYIARELKKITALETLTAMNFEKIYITVLDLEEELQMNPGPSVKISLDLGRETDLIPETFNSGPQRANALDYLKSKNVVRQYKIHPMADMGIASFVVVDLNLRRFDAFKKEIREARPLRNDLGTKSKAEIATVAKPEAATVRSNGPITTSYLAEYNSNREIIVNGFLLATPDYESDNDRLFRYLIDNPNKVIKRADIPQDVLAESGAKKDFHKFVWNLGFRGDLRAAFFALSKTSITFRNPVGPKELESAGLKRLRLPTHRQKPS